MTKMPSREEMLKQIRARQAETVRGHRDPDEFRVPKVRDVKDRGNYYFRVLPQLDVGDKCSTGVCDVSNGLWYYENGAHWINRDKVECPRIHDNEECPLCDMGFKMLSRTNDEEGRKRISRKYLSRSNYAINVYFLNSTKNPENIRGKVMWFNAGRTIWEKMINCIEADDGNEDEQGGVPKEAKASGIFYHPWEGGYIFKLIARKKGDWNDYEESSFLVNSFEPLVKRADGSPDDEAINVILAKRHCVQKKFKDRSLEKLNQIVQKIMLNDSGEDATDDQVEDVEIAGVRKGGASQIPPKEEVTEDVREDAEGVREDVVEEPIMEEAPQAPQAPQAPVSAPKVTPKTSTPMQTPKAQQKAKPKPQAIQTASAAPTAAPGDDIEDEDVKRILNEIKSKK